jgi:rod shape-determining protein MreC
MPLGTLDRTPPPFFRQGLSALTKLGLFSALAVLLMVADARWRVVDPLRAALSTALLPVQRAPAGGSPITGEDAAAWLVRAVAGGSADAGAAADAADGLRRRHAAAADAKEQPPTPPRSAADAHSM